MFNIGGGEMLVILLLALIVLGPQRLPDAAKQIGKVMGDLRRMSSGFQQELRSAMDDPIEAAARERGAKAAARRPTPAPPEAPSAEPTEAAAEATEPETRPPVKKQAAAKKAAAKKATATAKKAPARKRTAPLRAPGKPDGPAAQ